jgi:glycosyltransferase involved in cell wall biosynthesis
MNIAMYGLRAIGQGSGGVEKAVEELGVRLVPRGHRVTVFCRRRYNFVRVKEYRGVRLVNLPALYTKHLEAITHSMLAAFCSTKGFDLVHVHAVGPSLTSFIPRMAGRRVVVTVHAMDWLRDKWGALAKCALALGARAAVTFPHRTIVVSKRLQEFFWSSFHRETIYIPNGVPPMVRRPLNRLRRWGLKGNDYLLFLGRLVPEKGCHLLLDAFQRSNLSCRLLIVGDATHTTDYLDGLRQKAQGDPRIMFAGALFGEDKEEAYSNALGLVFPSMLEGMPIVLLEALAIGCPVLCSDIPENMEIVSPPGASPISSAVVCPVRETDRFVSALVRFVEEADTLRSRALNESPRIAARYDWDHIVDQTEQVYLQL